MKQTTKPVPPERGDKPAVPVAAGDRARSAPPPARRPSRNAPKHEQFEYWLGEFSRTDLLTELPNRRRFFECLSAAMERVSGSKQLVGAMLLNIDHFKALNAARSYRVADLVLQKLAERLRGCTRKSETLARIGGDEFAVILEALNEKEGAVAAAKRLLKALGLPLALDGGEVAVTATIGVAFYPADADNVDRLLQCADVALCHGLDLDRGTWHFYSPEMQVSRPADEARRTSIEQGLARLTRREREVLEMLLAGHANRTIAEMLGTSARTVEHHRAKIMAKMSAQSLPELLHRVREASGGTQRGPRA